MLEPQRLPINELQFQMKKPCVLVLTANPIERGIFLRWMAEHNYGPVLTYMIEGYAFNVQRIAVNGIDVSIVHADPGKTGEELTRQIINTACSVIQPTCICEVGICYGFNRRRNTVGTVFLSESITVFRINFRDSDKNSIVTLEPEMETEKQPADNFVQALRGRLLYTMIPSLISREDRPFFAKAEIGKLISVNSLISNKQVKEVLLGCYENSRTKPLGGEMEGAGLLKSEIVQGKGFDRWLIIKSICDWGEVKNNLEKDKEKNELIKNSIQALAMCNSVGVFEKLLPELCEV